MQLFTCAVCIPLQVRSALTNEVFDGTSMRATDDHAFYDLLYPSWLCIYHTGFMHIVEWLHAQGAPATVKAMDSAAGSNNLAIIRLLHKHRREGA